MQTIGRAITLYWAVYALDFATSFVFISLGYGFAETNGAQVALLAAPNATTLWSWMLDQNVWLVVGVASVIGFVFRSGTVGEYHIPSILGFMTVLRLFGVASNVAFTLRATLGISLAPPICYALFLVPLALMFRRELGGTLGLARTRFSHLL